MSNSPGCPFRGGPSLGIVCGSHVMCVGLTIERLLVLALKVESPGVKVPDISVSQVSYLH